MNNRTYNLVKWHILYIFLCDWHGGQWSRGYRLLCLTANRLERRYGRPFYWMDNEQYAKKCRNSLLYQYLVNRYASKM